MVTPFFFLKFRIILEEFSLKKFFLIWIQEWSFLFLLLFKMVILYFWHFLAFCFQLGWHHHDDFIHILLPQKFGINEFVK